MLDRIQRIINWFRTPKKLSVNEVFTTSVAIANYLERESIENRFERAVENPGKQIVVYGHSGGGKTTLIENVKNKLSLRIIESFCINTTSVDELVQDAFDKLNLYFTSEKVDSDTLKLFTEAKAELVAGSVKSRAEAASSTSQKNTRVVSVQVTAQRLSEFLGKSEMMWLIDDFHKLPEETKKSFSQMLKVFSTQSKNYPKLKIICVGAERKAREVVDYDPEMNDRVAEIHVPLLTDAEIKGVVINGFDLLNIEIGDSIVNEIAQYSNKLATVTHNLCNHLCHDLGVSETQESRRTIESHSLTPTLSDYIQDKSDSYKQLLDIAIKQKRSSTYNNCELIVRAFLTLEQPQATHAGILAEIHKRKPNYPPSNLTVYLRQLCSDERGEFFIFDEDSNKFAIRDPFMHGYAKMVFAELDRNNKNRKQFDPFKNIATKVINKELIESIVQMTKIISSIS